MKKELLNKHKQEPCRWWQQEQADLEEYRVFQTARHEVRKAKALIVNLPRDARSNKKSFHVYVSDRRKTMENVGLFWNRKIKQETWLACTWRRLRYSTNFFASAPATPPKS